MLQIIDKLCFIIPVVNWAVPTTDIDNVCSATTYKYVQNTRMRLEVSRLQVHTPSFSTQHLIGRCHLGQSFVNPDIPVRVKNKMHNANA